MAAGPRLEGPGITLRPLSADDIETVRQWRNRDDVRRWFTNSAPISAEEQQRWFARQDAQPGDFVWIIESPGADMLGIVSVYGLDSVRREAEFGRIIAAPDARGAGHMFSACRTILRHCFDDLELKALRLEVMQDNSAALRLYRQCGFRVTDDSSPLLQMRLERTSPEGLRPLHPPHPARTVWLASYPKSGNTWLRLFLANLLYPEKAPVDINFIPMRTPISGSRSDFDLNVGAPSAFLLPEEIERLRPCSDLAMAAKWPERMLLRKTHDAWTQCPDGRPIMGRGPDFAAVYLYRDPCDVAVSAANHWGLSPDDTAESMLRQNATLAGSRMHLSAQLPQRTLSWQQHVETWLQAPIALWVLRYEEMHRHPLRCFRGALRFLGYGHEDAAICAALDASRFESLQQQEEKSGFREGPAGRPFFRSGKSGEGAALLSAANGSALTAARAAVEPLLQARGF